MWRPRRPMNRLGSRRAQGSAGARRWAMVLLAASLAAVAAALSACATDSPAQPLAAVEAEPQQLTPAPTTMPTATLTPTATPTPLPTATLEPTPVPLGIDVRVSSATIAQGETIQIEVTCNQPCRASARWGDRDIRMSSPADDRAWGALAAHALAEPGPQELQVEAVTASGQRVTLTSPLPVVPGTFASEALTFGASTAALLDPVIADAENTHMNEIWSVYSPQRLWDGPFAWPWQGVITSEFGTRRVYQQAVQSFHTGIDIDGETGDAVLACAHGVVILAEPLQVRGNAVVINHGAGVMSGYFHLDQIDVTEGQIVAAGEQLGLMGSTGLSTGSHLHWELRVGGVAANPRQWADQAIGPLEEVEP